MRKIFWTAVILTVILTSCGTLDVTIEDPSAPTPTATATPAPGSAPLSMDSTSDDIRQVLLDSPRRWRTIFMDAQVTTRDEAPRRVQTWVDQPNLAARSLSGNLNSAASSLRVANSTSLLALDIPGGESKLIPFLDGSLSVPYTPAPPALRPGQVQPHPLSTAVDPAMSALLFPSDLAQNEGTFKPITTEVVAYHLCLVVEWAALHDALPSYRAWVDVSTGVFLRFQQFDKGGGTDISSEVTVTRVDYDLPFSPDLFSLSITAMPNFVTDPQRLAAVEVTPAATPAVQDPLGMVYSFVTDSSSVVRVTRLVRLPASCVVGKSDCPQPEAIKTPVELTYSLQPMVWSPTRYEAAWAYPVNADGRIWTLYLFDPLEKSWTELAQFDRLMDPPMWSQDGTWLAFRLQDGQGNSEIYAIRRDGTEAKNLTSSDQLPAAGKPYGMDSWLGEDVLLRSAKPGQAGTVYLMRVDDGSVKPLFDTQLTKSPFLEAPNGALLATVNTDADSQKQVVKILTPDGKTLRDLATFSTGSILGLAWSADGKQLAFDQRTDAAAILYVIDVDGRNLRQVYTSTTDTQFVFSPDGSYLLVQTIDGTGEHLYSIELANLEVHLVQAPGVRLNEAWMFPAWRK